MDLGVDAPGLGGPSVPVVPAQVGVDRGVLLGVARIVGAVERKPIWRVWNWHSMRLSQLA
jgi:hypothetical protein